MGDTIGPGWSGFVTLDVIEPLAQAIERQFGHDKKFSTLFHSKDDPFSSSCKQHEKTPVAHVHRHLDEIRPHADPDYPYIWIVSGCQWSIHAGTFVCLTTQGIFTERTFSDSRYEVWCWILED